MTQGHGKKSNQTWIKHVDAMNRWKRKGKIDSSKLHSGNIGMSYTMQGAHRESSNLKFMFMFVSRGIDSFWANGKCHVYFDHKPHKPHACSWRLLFWSGEDISQSSTCSRFHKETMVKQRLHWVKVQESCWKAKMFVPLENSDHFSWQNAGTATGLRDDCWWLNNQVFFSFTSWSLWKLPLVWYHWYGTPSFLTNPKWVWLCDL